MEWDWVGVKVRFTVRLGCIGFDWVGVGLGRGWIGLGLDLRLGLG